MLWRWANRNDCLLNNRFAISRHSFVWSADLFCLEPSLHHHCTITAPSLHQVLQNIQGTQGQTATVGRWHETSGLRLWRPIVWAGNKTAPPAGIPDVAVGVLLPTLHSTLDLPLQWAAKACFQYVNQNTTLLAGDSIPPCMNFSMSERCGHAGFQLVPLFAATEGNPGIVLTSACPVLNLNSAISTFCTPIIYHCT